MEELFQSFLNNQLSFLYDTNFLIDYEESIIENGFEFKGDDLQENYWNIDEVEDFLTNEQLIHPMYNSLHINNEYRSSHDEDQSKFLKKKRFLNDKNCFFEKKEENRIKNEIVTCKRICLVKDRIKRINANTFKNIKFDFKVELLN